KGGSHQRALHRVPLARAAVSILSRPEGREPRAGRVAAGLLPAAVSILSRPEGREPRQVLARRVLQPRFQSSPAPKGGSHARVAAISSRYWAFQSSPAPKGGSHLLRAGGHRGRAVSILSRPEGREPPAACGRTSRACCFNPLPPRRAGATSPGCRGPVALPVVSILSR